MPGLRPRPKTDAACVSLGISRKKQMPHSKSGLFEKDLMKGILYKEGGETLREGKVQTVLLRAATTKGRARGRVWSRHSRREAGFQLKIPLISYQDPSD